MIGADVIVGVEHLGFAAAALSMKRLSQTSSFGVPIDVDEVSQDIDAHAGTIDEICVPVVTGAVSNRSGEVMAVGGGVVENGCEPVEDLCMELLVGFVANAEPRGRRLV
jgi:hypothetical protein